MTLAIRIAHRFPNFALDVDFTAPGGVTALFGKSGSGKTTVVKATAGVLRADAARIAVGDRVLADSEKRIWTRPHQRRVGYVFQESRLFPHLSVAENLRYGLRFLSTERRRTAAQHEDRIVEMLGLGAMLNRRPAGLSGGETQRVAIGRALLPAPDVLLMDEPLASLDAPRKADILPYLERLRDETAAPILYVSHSLAETARLATWVVTLQDGRVTHSGPADQVLTDPAAAPTLGLREAGSVLNSKVVAHHDDGLTELSVAGGRLLLPKISAALGADIRIRIQAQDVILARRAPDGLSALNILPGEVRAIRPGYGPGVIVQLDIAGDLLLARVTRRSVAALGLGVGSRCYAVLKSVAVAPSDIWTP